MSGGVSAVSLSLTDRRLLVVEPDRLSVVVLQADAAPPAKPKPIPLPAGTDAQHALETPLGTYVVAGKPGVIEVLFVQQRFYWHCPRM